MSNAPDPTEPDPTGKSKALQLVTVGVGVLGILGLTALTPLCDFVRERIAGGPVVTTDAGTVTPPAATGILVFDDALATGWNDFSFGVTNGGTGRAVNGAYEVSLGAWGALNLYNASFDSSKLSKLTFSLRCSTAVSQVYVSTGGQATYSLGACPTALKRFELERETFETTPASTNLLFQVNGATTLVVDDVSYTLGQVTQAPDAGTPPVVVPPVPSDGRIWRIGYVVSYLRDMVAPAALPYSSYTHLAIGRVVPNNDGSLNESFDIGAAAGQAWARDVSARAKAAGVVPLLQVGGSGAQAAFASASRSGARTAFVTNLLSAMDRYGCAGLDLNHEPLPANAEADFLALSRALRVARPGIILTVPLMWTPESAPFFARNAAVWDRMSLMSYQTLGLWDGWRTWVYSALKGETVNTPTSVTKSVDAFLAAGVPAAKLGIGIGLYGICHTGATAPLQPIAGVREVAGDNVITSTLIERAKAATPALYRYDTVTEQPYLSGPHTINGRSCTYTVYEDARSIAAKGAYAKSRGLGAVIVWTAEQGPALAPAIRSAF